MHQCLILPLLMGKEAPSPKHWYLSMKLRGGTSQKAAVSTDLLRTDKRSLQLCQKVKVHGIPFCL